MENTRPSVRDTPKKVSKKVVFDTKNDIPYGFLGAETHPPRRAIPHDRSVEGYNQGRLPTQ